jgi:hypothetical protein
MRLREGEQVSTLAPVVESGDDDADTSVVDAPAEEAVADDSLLDA